MRLTQGARTARPVNKGFGMLQMSTADLSPRPLLLRHFAMNVAAPQNHPEA